MLVSFSGYLNEPVPDPEILDVDPVICSVLGISRENFEKNFIVRVTLESSDFTQTSPYPKPLKLVFLKQNLYLENREKAATIFPMAMVLKDAENVGGPPITGLTEEAKRKWTALCKNYLLLLPLYLRNNGSFRVYGLQMATNRSSHIPRRLLAYGLSIIEFLCAGNFYQLNSWHCEKLSSLLKCENYACLMFRGAAQKIFRHFDIENTEGTYAN